MSSARQVRANRANARASTGPKTANGKERAARNSRRHGLAVSVLNDVQWAPEVAAWARHIMGEDIDKELLFLARKIAEAQVELRRTRVHKQRVIQQAYLDPRFPTARRQEQYRRVEEQFRHQQTIDALAFEVDAILAEKPATSDAKLVEVFDMLARELSAIDRYERRAMSRRRFAIRSFDARKIEYERERQTSRERALVGSEKKL
jgi:hypothetical protein